MSSGAMKHARMTAVLAAFVLAIGLGVAPAVATTTAVSALVLRDGSRSLVRVDGIGSQHLAVGTENVTDGATTVPALRFVSDVGGASWTTSTVEVSSALTPGTYTTSRTPGAAQAFLEAPEFIPCGGAEPGTLTVRDASYDANGLPTTFSASFDVDSCDSMPAVHGEIRYASTDPLGAATAPDLTSIPTTVVVGSTAELPVTFTAVGNTPITLGAASLQQKTLWDGSTMWQVHTDGCAGRTLAPGDTCEIDLSFGSARPDGTPSGTEYATVLVPDGSTDSAIAPVQAKIAPLPGQAIGLHARGLFRHTILTWGAPQAYPASWDPRTPLDYQIVRVASDGSRSTMAFTRGARSWRLTGQPDDYTATYLVIALQGASAGPDSVPATTTTATSEDLLADQDAGGLDARNAPDPEPEFSSLWGSGAAGTLGIGTKSLAVSRNQAVLAYERRYSGTSGLTSVVGSTRTDDANGQDFTSSPPGSAWDVEPALSPDGSKVVYTHASAQNAPTDLRVASTTTGSTATDVPGTAGLSDAVFATAGTLVAVRKDNGSTDLVTVGISTGTITAIANSAGLSQPDVAADGRIVAVRHTDPATATATGLVILPADRSAATPIAAAQSGSNVGPQFSADGSSVFFVHNDVASDSEWGDATILDLATGHASTMTDAHTEQSPYVLEADGHDQPDTSAPLVTFTAPTPTTLDRRVIASVWAVEGSQKDHQTSGLSYFDIRYRTATPDGTFGSYLYPAGWQHTYATSTAKNVYTHGVSLAAVPGNEYCFSARARDFADNLSPWSAEKCTTTPLDDRALASSAQRVTGAHYYGGTSTQIAKKGMTFTASNVSARHVAMLVTTCPTCGAVDVRIGGHDLGVVNTTSKTTKYEQVKWLPASAALTGALVITTTSSSPVRIDGVLLAH